MAVDIRKRRIREYFGKYRVAFVLGAIALIATQALALTIPQLLRIATDGLIEKQGDVVEKAAVALMGVALLGAVIRITSRILIFNSGRRVEYDIRNDVFQHLQSLPPSFYQRMPLGQVMSRMVNDLTQVRLVLGPGILNVANTTLVYLVVIPLLFYTDWVLASFSLLPLPALLLAGRFFAKRMYALSREQQQRLGALSAKAQENLSGAMTVRAYRQEPAESQHFKGLNDVYLDVNIRLARLRGIMFPLMGVGGALGGVVVLWIGGHRIASEEMTIGQYVQFAAYLAALTWPTIALGWMISLWQRGMAAMDRINEIFLAAPDISDGPQDAPGYDGNIEFIDLEYTYEGASEPALTGINAKIQPGETVVIVGKTGSGKTTLLRCLARLLPIEDGKILLDGRDVNQLPLAAVRTHLGYAPQDAFLFSRSLFENVAFSTPHATEDEVEAAVRLASLDEDISGFPRGLQTVVGERGVTLSGGQRQRTTLARAILNDPDLLLLDDTLSAVDTETETKILQALTSGEKKRTIIACTHRLAFAAHADRILVLENGRLAEQGTEAELLANGGIYAAMHRRQRLRSALEEDSSRAQAPAEVPA